jgi:hypothetical protein
MSRMRAGPTKVRPFREALRRMGAKLEEWQVRALILGAQASTNLQVGPQHLIDRICGESPQLGTDLADANANLASLMELWNALVLSHDRDRVQLSAAPRTKRPTPEQLEALALRREEELVWFLRGLDAAGQDPEAFGPEGEHLFRGLAKGGAILKGIRELMARGEIDPDEAHEQINGASMTIERIIGNILTLGQEVRGREIETMVRQKEQEGSGKTVVRAAPRTGRNSPCPCGSGRKWKHCCGSPSRLH